MVGQPDHPRTGRAGLPHQPPHRHPSPDPTQAWSAQVHRPQRSQQPQARQDHRPLAGSHGTSGREEGRPDPRGGGWRIHGRNSAQKRAVDRAKTAGAKAGYLYLHPIVDGFSRLAYTEPLDDEKGTTAAAFLARAKVWFAAHGITHIHRIVTDNGACYRSNDFARIVGHRTRHQETKPYTPRHNGKAERYQRIMTEELLYAREYASEDERSQAIAIWNVHYNYHRPHSAAGGQPPASRLKTRVTNVRPSYS